MIIRELEYSVGGKSFVGELVAAAATSSKRPGVLVCHARAASARTPKSARSAWPSSAISPTRWIYLVSRSVAPSTP
jgi:hypothetical protein